MIESFTSFDLTVLQWIHSTFTSPALDYLMPKITALGNGGIVWIVAALVLLCRKQYRKYGFTLIVGLLAGVLVGNVFLKNLIERPRPSWNDLPFTLLIANPLDYSFPSGHTLASVIAATILTMSNKKFGYIAIPLACLIAFSRLYLFVHYPSDVLGAALIGLLIGVLVFIGFDFIWKGKNKSIK